MFSLGFSCRYSFLLSLAYGNTLMLGNTRKHLLCIDFKERIRYNDLTRS